jgi:hypothetical protein
MKTETRTDGEYTYEVMWPPNKIKEKVTLGGTIPGPGFDAAVLRRAEKATAKLLADFDDALDDDVERIVVAFETMVEDPDGSDALAAEIAECAGRAAGRSKQAGLSLLADVCLSVANFLAIEGVAPKSRLEVVKVHVDAVRLIYFRQVSGHGGEQGAELVRLITEATAQFRK